jgi:glycosyltransferase involved in cell wall biosynthesis
MDTPQISFVIPCYNLGHFLVECVDSILKQTYSNLEVLIMDDCSPDNTMEVSQSFKDLRVRYVRNHRNLGPLRNYNAGISLSQGKYVWLISADDYLKSRNIAEKYVALMESHPRVGYTFCPGIGVRDGKEGQVWNGSEYGRRDRVIRGQHFLKTLLKGNQLLAPSVMVRRSCYDTIGMFPLDVVWAGQSIDLVWGGDWYLWCVFALFFDVGYFAEPMVCYRQHALSMTNVVTQINKSDNCAAAEIGTASLVKQKATAAKQKKAAHACLRGIALLYVRHCLSRQYDWLDSSARSCISLAKAEEWLSRSPESKSERKWIRARLFSALGDDVWFKEQPGSARDLYKRALEQDWTMAGTYVKLLLLSFGRVGSYLRFIRRRRHTRAMVQA